MAPRPGAAAGTAARVRAADPRPAAATEVERLVVQRVGQDVFRAALMDYWGSRCAITGCAEPLLLRASHIKPWAQCATDAERLDVYNGLLLAAHLDAAFDAGLIDFDDAGQLRFAERFSPADRLATGARQLNGTRQAYPRAPRLPGLAPGPSADRRAIPLSRWLDNKMNHRAYSSADRAFARRRVCRADGVRTLGTATRFWHRRAWKFQVKFHNAKNRSQPGLSDMAHSVPLASLLHPKSAVFAAESSRFAVASSTQIAFAPKSRSQAMACPHHTLGSHQFTEVTHRVRTALRQGIENGPWKFANFPDRRPSGRVRCPTRPMV